MGEVHIYAPEYAAARRILRCYTCRQQRRMVQLMYAWHPSIAYCTVCGEQWGDRAKFSKITPERARKIRKANELYKAAGNVRCALKRLREMIEAEESIGATP